MTLRPPVPGVRNDDRERGNRQCDHGQDEVGLLPGRHGSCLPGRIAARKPYAGATASLCERTSMTTSMPTPAPETPGAVHVPEGGFWPAPPVPQPNIYPMEWRGGAEKNAGHPHKNKQEVSDTPNPP